MSPTDDASGSSIDGILARYMEQLDRGEAVDREKIIAENPRFAEELRAYFAGSDVFAGPAAEKHDATLSAPGPPKGTKGVSLHARLRYFGEYEILEEIARGGMGVVYKARQMTLERQVALKVILEGDFASEASIRRFRREAEAAAQLDHPNIVPIYEVGEQDGLQYYTMKLIHGSSLKDARKSLIGSDQKSAAALVSKIARAVDYAHRGGVVHRDLKPANVLIDAAGEPHVTDFGLARRFGNQRAVTVTNTIVGTPSYMAPEQAEGSAMTTTAADIYALGAILFELLAGEPPFQGGSALETLRQVIEDEPRKLSMLRADVDRDLEAIAQRCLEKRPERRYRTAAEMADDLDRFREGKPTHARPVSWTRRSAKWLRRRRQSVSVAALVVTLAGIAVGLTVSARRSADFQRRDQIKSVLQQAVTQNVRLEHLESYTPAIQAGLKERLTGGDEELAALVRSLSIQIYPDLTTYGLESKPPLLHLLFANAQELIPIFSFAEVEGSWDGGPWTPLHSATCSARMGFGATTDLVETFGRERVNEGPHRLALRANVELYDPRSFARQPSTSIIKGGGRSSWPELEQGKRLSREARDLGEHRITLFETYPASFPERVTNHPDIASAFRPDRFRLIVVDYRPEDAPCREVQWQTQEGTTRSASMRALNWRTADGERWGSPLPCAKDSPIERLVVGARMAGAFDLRSRIGLAGQATLTFAEAPGHPITFGFGMGGGRVFVGDEASFHQNAAGGIVSLPARREPVILDFLAADFAGFPDVKNHAAMTAPLQEGVYDAEFRLIPSRDLALATSRIDRLYDRPFVIPVRVEITRAVVERGADGSQTPMAPPAPAKDAS